MTTKKDLFVISVDQLNKQENFDKYKVAGTITNNVLEEVIDAIKPGVALSILCELGDRRMNSELQKVFTKKKLEYGKGIAFPTCISRNNEAGFNSPCHDKVNTLTERVQEGDVLKIELGVHIDAFPVCLCYTHIVGDLPDKSKERVLNVVNAVAEAQKEIMKLMKPDKKNIQVAKVLQKCAKKYNCNLLHAGNISKLTPGILSHQISRGRLIDGIDEDLTIDGEEDFHTIILNQENEKYDFGMSEVEFVENEVYCIDIAMSTCCGRITYGKKAPNLFRRNRDVYTKLKLKSSKAVYNKFKNTLFPIARRDLLTDLQSGTVKVGLRECVEKNLITPFDTYYENEGEYVVRSKFTVLIRKKPKLFAGKSKNKN